MTGTPTSFAEAPGAAGQGRDLLADMLRAVRLTGSVYMNARMTAPFGIMTPPQFDESKPLAHLRHVSIFHLIASGTCTVEVRGEAPCCVSAGDVLLVPFAGAHRIWNGDYGEEVDAETLARPGPIEGMWRIDHGGGGETTRIVCGFIESSEFLFAPVFRSLPPLLVYNSDSERVGAVITSTVRQILDLADEAAPGAELMLGYMMQMLFMEVLRRHVNDVSGSKNWLTALGDPIVRRALQAVHENPTRRWTVDDLARQAGTSRTVLADRFRSLMGQTPMDYVTGWRMQIAAGRLRDGRDSIGMIAADVGYESEAAFNRAFKRVTGVTPGQWRAASQTPP
jgi:AraC family transcriptional regulator, alkane utilization regulator